MPEGAQRPLPAVFEGDVPKHKMCAMDASYHRLCPGGRVTQSRCRSRTVDQARSLQEAMQQQSASSKASLIHRVWDRATPWRRREKRSGFKAQASAVPAVAPRSRPTAPISSKRLRQQMRRRPVQRWGLPPRNLKKGGHITIAATGLGIQCAAPYTTSVCGTAKPVCSRDAANKQSWQTGQDRRRRGAQLRRQRCQETQRRTNRKIGQRRRCRR